MKQNNVFSQRRLRTPACIDFGRLLASFFEHFWIKGAIKKSMIFYVVFFQFFFDFGLQVGTRPGHDSGGICLLRPPRASWRGCFGFVPLLTSSWVHFDLIWPWIFTLIRRILESISLFFNIVLQAFGCIFALLIAPYAFNHEPQS